MKMNINEMKFGELKQIAAMFNTAAASYSNLAAAMVGEYVICRSRNEGINAGEVIAADDTGVILKDAIRIWHHRPSDKKMSWYEGVALSGLSSDSKTAPAVARKTIIEDYSLTSCSAEARKSIEEHTPNEQN